MQQLRKKYCKKLDNFCLFSLINFIGGTYFADPLVSSAGNMLQNTIFIFHNDFCKEGKLAVEKSGRESVSGHLIYCGRNSFSNFITSIIATSNLLIIYTFSGIIYKPDPDPDPDPQKTGP